MPHHGALVYNVSDQRSTQCLSGVPPGVTPESIVLQSTRQAGLSHKQYCILLPRLSRACTPWLASQASGERDLLMSGTPGLRAPIASLWGRLTIVAHGINLRICSPFGASVLFTTQALITSLAGGPPASRRRGHNLPRHVGWRPSSQITTSPAA